MGGGGWGVGGGGWGVGCGVWGVRGWEEVVPVRVRVRVRVVGVDQGGRQWEHEECPPRAGHLGLVSAPPHGVPARVMPPPAKHPPPAPDLAHALHGLVVSRAVCLGEVGVQLGHASQLGAPKEPLHNWQEPGVPLLPHPAAHVL
jgi:hypothetical protein